MCTLKKDKMLKKNQVSKLGVWKITRIIGRRTNLLIESVFKFKDKFSKVIRAKLIKTHSINKLF